MVRHPALRCYGVSRTYRSAATDLSILRGVDLEVGAGEVVAVLGPSGSGKSTLIHLLAGLDAPDEGEIWWGDLPVHERGPRRIAAERSERVGLIFQNHYLLAELDALENVCLPGRIAGKHDPDRGRELLAAVGLSARTRHRPNQLSGGERQRIAVARALFHRPGIVLADEPTGSLDRRHAAGVFDMLLELGRAEASAVVVVTHDEDLVKHLPRRYELENGVLEPSRRA